MSTSTQLVPYTDAAREQDKEYAHHRAMNLAIGAAIALGVIDLAVRILAHKTSVATDHAMNICLILITFAGCSYNVRKEKISMAGWFMCVTVSFSYSLIRVATIASTLLSLSHHG